MDLQLDSKAAQAADNISAGIRESGKYIGTITRAELLTSAKKGTLGLGLSFRTDGGQTADYLDLWHTSGDGEKYSGWQTVNAVMCCTKTAALKTGTIQCEKWDNDSRSREKMDVPGYPGLMGKRVGLLLRQTLETDQNGKDRERLEIFGVFNAETELTATEMYAKATEPKRLASMVEHLAAHPVRDARKKKAGSARGQADSSGGGGGGSFSDMDDDIPFITASVAYDMAGPVERRMRRYK